MKWNAVHAVSAVFALALAALLAGQAHAVCGGSQKMSHQSAECLRAEISTAGNGKTVEVQNLCPDYGQVVAKIDREIEADLILYLTTGNTAEQSVSQVNGVYCCKDLSDLCNKSDIVNDDSCLDQYRDSSADGSCKWETATATSNDRCKISAVCKDKYGMYIQLKLEVTVSWPDAARLHNCNAGLQVGEC